MGEVGGGDPVGFDDLGTRIDAVVGGFHGVTVGGGLVSAVAVPADAAVVATSGRAVACGGRGGTQVGVVNEAADVVLLAHFVVEDSALLVVEDLEADLVVAFLAGAKIDQQCPSGLRRNHVA